MPHSDSTPLDELRRNAIAALAVLVAVGLGVLVAVAWTALFG